MSGGIAYVLDEDGGFRGRCNPDLVGLERVEDDRELRALVEEHGARTGSAVAARLLAAWDEAVARFVPVVPQALGHSVSHAPEPDHSELHQRSSSLTRTICRPRSWSERKSPSA